MLDPLDSDNRPLLETLRRRRRSAWFVLLIENISVKGWRLLSWFLFFAALWILEAPQIFGATGQIGSLLAFLAGLAYFAIRDFSGPTLPHTDDVDRRLEKNSSFRRGQIRTIEDRLANPQKRATRELWDKGQKQMLQTIPGLHKPELRPLMIKLDPRALRFAVILLFISAVLVAGSDWQRRLWSGIIPVTPSYILSQGRSDELWITPPEYTNIPGLHITGSGLSEPVKIPEDSQIKIRTYSTLGDYFPPGLTMGDKTLSLPALGDGLYGLETAIAPSPSDSIRITQMLITRADWKYEYIPDTPPNLRSDVPEESDQESEEKITSAEEQEQFLEEFALNSEKNEKENEEHAEEKLDLPPSPQSPDEKIEKEEEIEEASGPYEVLPNGQIRFPLIVQDDYGVTDLTMTMRLDPMVTEKPRGKEETETRPVMSSAGVEMKVQPIYDLTGHTWAGLPVLFEFSVKDHKNQQAALAPLSLTLPEREFKHPVARLLIALRKKVAWSPGNNFKEIASELEAVLSAPDLFHDDIVVYLAIRTASSRLFYTNDKSKDEIEKAADSVIKLLWETAISIEDGNLSVAVRNLRQVQKELENALRDPNTSPEEIARLMDKLRESMLEYFIELSRELEKRMAESEDIPMLNPEDLSKMIDPEALSGMMDQLESDLQSGDRDAAREKLSQLQNLLDLMDPSMEAPLPEDMQMAMEGINELQQLIESQEALRDQTQKQADIQKMTPRTPEKPGRTIPPNPKVIEDLGLSGLPPPPDVIPEDPQPPISGMPPSPGPAQAPLETQDSAEIEEETRASPQTGKKKQISGNTIPGPVDTRPNKEEQEALRYVLGSLMLESSEKLGNIPEGMAKAELEMRGSTENLSDNLPAESIPHQDKAIEYLKEAQEQLQKQLSARMQQMVGLGFNSGQKYDPLGRPYGGQEDGRGPHHGSTVKVPDEAEKKRVEDILKELRRRSGEMDRPLQEREYYRRLLRQF